MHHGLREDTRNSNERTRGLVPQVQRVGLEHVESLRRRSHYILRYRIGTQTPTCLHGGWQEHVLRRLHVLVPKDA